MTTVGVLAPDTRRSGVDALLEWADVLWGVDTVAEAMSRIADSPIDVLVTEASVAFLTDELVGLYPERVGTICAIAEAEAMQSWVSSIAGVTAVRDISDVKSLTYVPEVAHKSTPAGTTEHLQPKGSRVIAVWGPVGSPGVTTTAISLATVCAQAGLSVVLCDADTRGASIAVALGITDETPGFAAACRLAGRDELTADEIRRIAVDVNREGIQFSVLTGLPRASRWAEIAPRKSRAVLDVVKTMFDVVVVDTGFGVEENEWIDDAPQRDGTAREILRSADDVIAVGAADAVGLGRIIRGLDDIRDLCPNPVLLLNRPNRGEGSEARDAIHRFTEHRVRTTIPTDSRGGVEDALARARLHPAQWRELASLIGLTLATPRRVWWRR